MAVPPDTVSGAQRRAERAAAGLFERDRASQGVQQVRVCAGLREPGEGHAGECLVHLEDSDVVEA